MISDERDHPLTVKARQPKNIVQFFRESPLVGVDLDLERDKDAGRDVEIDAEFGSTSSPERTDLIRVLNRGVDVVALETGAIWMLSSRGTSIEALIEKHVHFNFLS